MVNVCCAFGPHREEILKSFRFAKMVQRVGLFGEFRGNLRDWIGMSADDVRCSVDRKWPYERYSIWSGRTV